MIKDNKKYDILIIEDNPGDFNLISEYLQEQIVAPVITQVQNFKEAAFLLSAGLKTYDVILLDLSLPDGGGESLIAQIVLLARGCPVIVLTAFADLDFSIKSLGLGVADYLLKDDISASSVHKSILYTIERKKANIRLQESEKRYSNLFNLSPQSMWVYDPDTFRFVQVNKAALECYGFSEAEFLSMTIFDLREKTVVPVKFLLPDERNSRENGLNGSQRHYTKSGQPVEVELYSTPIMINDKIFTSVIAIDVTEKFLTDQKITMAIIKTQENERYEIGGELHDNVCQILAASQLSLGMIRNSIEPASVKAFNNCNEYITLATNEIRNLSHRLAPVFFDDMSLEEAFRRLLNTMNLNSHCNTSLNIHTEVNNSTISRDVQLNLYRILQEELANIVKHAKATQVQIEVAIDGDNLIMDIADNGVGFNLDSIKQGIGLANISRRAGLFGGTSTVESSLNKGCKITIQIPLN
ncbi:MAG: response regulator [Bacteroidota bacterium]